MILLPIVALILGAAVALAIKLPAIPGAYGQYLAVACLAGFDTICGGVRAGLEDKFRADVFITGFVSNVLIAFFLAWFGDQIYINLFLAVALVLGARIFTNLSLIRRYGLTKWQDSRTRKRLQAQNQAVVSAQPKPNP
ncbi:MAG: small basic family protein [Fimbriimonas sp.]|nr:small basic family protein [Fimbriimonas sp.]